MGSSGSHRLSRMLCPRGSCRSPLRAHPLELFLIWHDECPVQLNESRSHVAHVNRVQRARTPDEIQKECRDSLPAPRYVGETLIVEGRLQIPDVASQPTQAAPGPVRLHFRKWLARRPIIVLQRPLPLKCGALPEDDSVR